FEPLAVNDRQRHRVSSRTRKRVVDGAAGPGTAVTEGPGVTGNRATPAPGSGPVKCTRQTRARVVGAGRWSPENGRGLRPCRIEPVAEERLTRTVDVHVIDDIEAKPIVIARPAAGLKSDPIAVW